MKTIVANSRMIDKFYCCITSLFLFVSCGGEITNVLNYDDFDRLPVVSLEEVFEPLEFIPLQTNDSSVISNILTVCMSDDSFYILSVNPYRINRYSLDGAFISAISREGRAEGEYVAPSDIYFDEHDGILYIDDAVNGIMMYKSDGTYLSTFHWK